MKAAGAIVLSLAAGARGDAVQHKGGWCRPSDGVGLKSYLRWEDPEEYATSSWGCFKKCEGRHGSNLACAEFVPDEQICYCMRKAEKPGGLQPDFCWSKGPGSISYVVNIDKPPDCGQGYDCCSCELADTSSGTDNCADWDLRVEKKFCMDDVSIPVPTGEQCYHGYGEVHTCCKKCGAGEVPNRETQVCPCGWGHDNWEEVWPRLMLATLAGTVVSVVCIVAASLPVCCGVGKESNLCCQSYTIGAIACFCIFIPLFGAANATAASPYCERCDCDALEATQDGPHNFSTSVAVAYLYAGGLFVVTLAGVAITLACCMCNPCCGPLLAQQQNRIDMVQPGGGARLPPVVVGQVLGSNGSGGAQANLKIQGTPVQGTPVGS